MNDSRAEPVVDLTEGFCVVPRATVGRLGFLLAALGGRMEDLAEEHFPGIGLAGHDYAVLAILDTDGPGTQHEIARLMNKAPGVIVAAVDQLESKGFVERQRDPADRRRSRVTLTPAGQRTLAEADALSERLVGELLGGLRASEIATLRDQLVRGLRFSED